MIGSVNIEEAKKQIKSAKKPIIILAKGDEFNRRILEYGKFDILVGLEAGKKKDGLKFLDSGLNGVIAKIAAKNNIAVGIDISEIARLDKKEKAIRLARIRQNIRICRKAGCKMAILNCEDKRNAQGLLVSLGASTKQAKEAVE